MNQDLFRSRVQEAMARNNVNTQSAAAALTGVDQGFFSRVLKKERIPGIQARTILRLAVGFRVSADYLLGVDVVKEQQATEPKDDTPPPSSAVRPSSSPTG